MSLQDVSAPPVPLVPPPAPAPTPPAPPSPALAPLAAPFETTDPELIALARALRNDPDLIHEFVRDTIATLPMGGSLKGPLGALLDGAGTSFDQAELMAVLLKLAGYAPQFVVGRIRLEAAQLASWLDADISFADVGGFVVSGAVDVVNNGGLAPADLVVSGSDIVSLTVNWAWVKVNILGTDYVFDPATKSYDRKAGIVSSLNTRMGYDQAAFLTSALSGATINPNDISNVNRGNLRTSIAGFSTSLVANLKNQLPDAGPDDVLGEAAIIPLPINTRERQQSLSYATAAQDFPDVPANWRTKLTVSVPGAASVLFTSAEVYGRRLSLFFDASIAPVLRLDGVVRATGSAVAAGSQVGIGIAIDHPYPGSFADQSGTQNVQASAGGAFILSNGWGPVGRAMIERHRRLLEENTAALPGNPAAEPVLGESLAMLGYTWLAEVSRAQHLCGRLGNTAIPYHHGVGIVGMAAPLPPANVTGPYVDLPFNVISTVQRRSVPPTLDRTPQEIGAFFVTNQLSSVLESGAIEQTQPGVPAVSTVKLLDIASQSQPIYDITNVAVFDAVRPQLLNYSNAFLDGLRIRIGQGFRAILHRNGQIQVNQWRGFGYFEINPTADGIGAIISGGYSGGFPTVDRPPAEVNLYAGLQLLPGGYSPLNTLLGLSPGDSYNQFTLGGDPLNLATGDYVLTRDDLAVGTGDFPYTLAFQRSYDSGRSGPGAGLGPGWRHGFDLTVTPDSDGFEGMAATSPQNGATSIAALFVMLDILNVAGTRPLDRLVVSTLVAQYWMEQLTGNVLRVARPGAVESFVRLANATYGAPIGSNSVLMVNGDGSTTLQTGDGVTLQFAAATQTPPQPGRITSWTSAAGAQVTFTYGANSLTVASNLGRSLTLTFAGGLLQTVSDGTRSVSYRYDVVGRLEFFRDPLANETRYTYDGTSSRLAQIFYPSNPNDAFVTNTYDVLGRVSQQRDGNNNLTEVFVAGRRTEMVEPSTNRHVWYFEPLGQVRLEVQDYGRNPDGTLRLNLQTASRYDGQSRLIRTTFPEGNRVETTYDVFSNPTLVKRVAKNGTDELRQEFTYLSPLPARPNFRRVETAKDPRNNVTNYEYTAGTGTLARTLLPAVARPGQPNPVRPQQAFTYTALGLLQQETDAEGRVTTYGYDGFGNLLERTVDAGAGRLNLKTTWTYDAAGNAITSVSPRGNVAGGTPADFQTLSTFDANRQLTRVRSNRLDDDTRYNYDPDDRVTQVRRLLTPASGGNPAVFQVTTTAYTRTGKTQRVTDANGVQVSYAYDIADRVRFATSSSGRRVAYAYDVLSRVTTITDQVFGTLDPGIVPPSIVAYPGGTVVRERRTYTDNGLLASSRDGNSNRTNLSYDGFDRLRQLDYADGLDESYRYDENGNVTRRTTRAGANLNATYDALNRLLTRAVPANASAPAVNYSYAYDLTGRPLQVGQSVDPGPMVYVYDTAGRLLSEQQPDGRTIAYAYDADGNRTSLTWPESDTQAYQASYAYDALNRMTRVFEGDTSGPRLVTYAYDLLSRRSTATFVNNVVSTWTYRLNDTVATVQHAFVGGAGVTFTYLYNTENAVRGRLVSDAAYQAAPTNPALALGTRAYAAANALNQYPSVAGMALSYDANGNLTGDGTWTYGYDAQSRLVSAARAGTTLG
ncbi:MAG TPA: DUF6531 domain-containing protein, partial [Phenylobacterium sp.]